MAKQTPARPCLLEGLSLLSDAEDDEWYVVATFETRDDAEAELREALGSTAHRRLRIREAR
jgi:hypothetical protein